MDEISCESENVDPKRMEVDYFETENTAAPSTVNEEDGSHSSTRRSNHIKPIDKNVVHRICSGQVVVTLATAVKELVENSIDAGATNVDISLVESGSKVIEVADNGSGVEESNFEGLGLKHHTSKIQQFEDLSFVETFGFRGEALSSLCSLSNLTVITKSRKDAEAMKNKSDGSSMPSEARGFKIEYDHKGRIKQKGPCAREFGTTVILKNLFSTLPVRHNEFLKNLKREFIKMIQVLYGYCLITNSVRITCTNKLESGTVSKIFSISASNTIREKIMCLFGVKEMNSLMEIKQTSFCDNETILSEFGLTEKVTESPYTLSGYISLPYKGRCSSDRQFLFINSRPCESAKITRIINEVYHSFSKNSRYPFVFLHIKTEQQNVDVNVTPDKRQIYLRNEKILYASIKATLISIMENATSSFSSDGLCQDTLKLSQISTVSDSSVVASEMDIDEESTTTTVINDQEDEDEETNDNNMNVKRTVHTDQNLASRRTMSSDTKSNFKNNVKSSAGMNDGTFFQKFAFHTKSKLGGGGSDNKVQGFSKSYSTSSSKPFSKTTSRNTKKLLAAKLSHFLTKKSRIGSDDDDDDIYYNCEEEEEKEKEQEEIVKKRSHVIASDSEYEMNSSETDHFEENFNNNERDDDDVNSNTISSFKKEKQEEIVIYDNEITDEDDNLGTTVLLSSRDDVPYTCKVYGNAKVVSINVNWDKVKENLVKDKAESQINADRVRKFRAGISTTENQQAEEELRKQLTKDMFKQMQILGQFNNGFIIVKHGPDIFIVDQHASDEKYNYETLEKSLTLQSQQLICPLDLHLPVASELVLMDRIDTFRKNGFDFVINEEGEPSTRVKLSKIPHSKAYEFGKEDIEELIFLLEDAPENAFYRPRRVRDMLASRACKKAVKIGNVLEAKTMRCIVDHMGQIEQPWNCPHGRPTIRHLINLNLLPDFDMNF